MRLSWCSTMPISMPRSRAPCSPKFRNMGQTCVCANRIYVQSAVHDAFAERLAARVAEMKVGNGLDEGVVQGPLINQAAVDKVEEHIADASAKGARVLVGGQRHALGGTFFEPTVMADVNPQMLVARDETFGPWRHSSGRARGRGGVPRQRHGIRPCQLFLCP